MSFILFTGEGAGIPACLAGQSQGGWVSQYALQVSPGGDIPACLAGQSQGGGLQFFGRGCGVVPGGGVSPIFGGVGNGQRSAGTHPTGMHSCYDIIFLLIYSSFSVDP